MQRKYTVASVLSITFALAGVVWSQSGPAVYALKVSPAGSTSCSALALLSPPFYKCANMEVLNVSGVQVGTADWAYSNGVLVFSLEKNGDVTNYSIPASQTLTGGSPYYPSCSAEWTIQTLKSADAPQVTIHLAEYRSGDGRVYEGCRASWDEGTVTQ